MRISDLRGGRDRRRRLRLVGIRRRRETRRRRAPRRVRSSRPSTRTWRLARRTRRSVVGGPGQAGYDGGFWIRGGSFLLKINLTIQTRFEYFDWDDSDVEPSPGRRPVGLLAPARHAEVLGRRDLRHPLLRRARVRPPRVPVRQRGRRERRQSRVALRRRRRDDREQRRGERRVPTLPRHGRTRGVDRVRGGSRVRRSGWASSRRAATRQLMTAPEMQQFVDISLASAFIGQSMPGYTDRNRDYGLMFHGALGCDGEFSYMVTVTNGDGPVHRNVHRRQRRSDNLAYSARVNWDLQGPHGLRGRRAAAALVRVVRRGGRVGALLRRPRDRRTRTIKFADRFTWGVDAAFGCGGFSFTAAYNAFTWDHGRRRSPLDGWSYLGQVGYLFPDTAWEIAARYSRYELSDVFGGNDFGGDRVGRGRQLLHRRARRQARPGTPRSSARTTTGTSSVTRTRATTRPATATGCWSASSGSSRCSVPTPPGARTCIEDSPAGIVEKVAEA